MVGESKAIESCKAGIVACAGGFITIAQNSTRFKLQQRSPLFPPPAGRALLDARRALARFAELAVSINVYLYLFRSSGAQPAINPLQEGSHLNIPIEDIMQALPNTPALKTQFDSQLNLVTELTQKTYDSVRKLSELNLQMARQMIEDYMNANRELLACSDPFQWTSTLMNQIPPAAERLRNYQQELIGVMTAAQSDLTRATEAYMPEVNRSAMAVADEMVRRSKEETEKMASRQRATLDTLSGAPYGGGSGSRH